MLITFVLSIRNFLSVVILKKTYYICGEHYSLLLYHGKTISYHNHNGYCILCECDC